ncbi:ATP-dependent helicase, partial [Halobacteriales archaeon QH_8_64_26]
MKRTVERLLDADRYRGRVQYHERAPARPATFTDIATDYRLQQAFVRQGIDALYDHQAAAIEAVREGENVVLATQTASGKSLAYTVPAFEAALRSHGQAGSQNSPRSSGQDPTEGDTPPTGRTLYIAPQRALINDQEETLAAFANDLGLGARVDVAQYTGQQSREQKREIREHQPDIVLTTPDSLHYALLPWSNRLWEWFFRTLDVVVIDEIHEYRGIFGSHVALVLRRLNRICERYDAAPQFVCCSATIGNPAEHARNVTGQSAESFTVVDEDASATSETHWLFWNPPLRNSEGAQVGARAGGESDQRVHGEPDASDATVEIEPGDGPEAITSDQQSTAVAARQSRSGSRTAPADDSERDSDSAPSPTDGQDGQSPSSPTSTGGDRRSSHSEAVTLFCDLLVDGYQTLVFTGSRQGAERYADWSANRLRQRGESELAEAVTAYQAALETEQREAIEAGLHDGSIRGVWSTNALELGVDVGGLDAVLLDGYPGTKMATHQRAGRAGRGEDASLVALIAGNDQLDQYVMGHPEDFFDGEPERAVVNPANEELLPEHVRSAAAESWLTPADDRHFGERFPDVVADLEEADHLDRRRTPAGLRWFDASEESPQHEMSLRTIDDRTIRLRDRHRNETIASLPFADALRDAHPEAIYYHQGRTYEVAELDLDRGRAQLETTDASHYTRALRDKHITVETDLDSATIEFGDTDGSKGNDETGGGELERPPLPIGFATVTMRERIDSYLRFDGPDDDGTEITLDEPLPETQLRTKALYFTVPPSIEATIREASPTDDGFAGAIHAVEHALISLFPLELLCDRRDIGGLSTPLHPHTGRSTVFVYDGYPGGVGLARGGYEDLEAMLGRTRELLHSCP